MAYQVLHSMKCNKVNCKGCEIHNERKITDDKDIYKSNTNENIDSTRTALNVALVGDMNSNYYQIAKSRITAIRGGISPLESFRDETTNKTISKLRKDAIWTVDTVISASPDFFKNNYKWDKENPSQADYEGMNTYFKNAVEFMQNRYGKDNVIGAIVHYDETTPHIHIQWTPINDKNKLSYKSLSSPVQLRNLQTDFNQFLRSKGYELERGEIDSKKKHLDQRTEKLNIAIKETDKKLAELEKVKADYEIMKEGSLSLPNLDLTKSKSKEIQKQNELLRRTNHDLKTQLEKVNEKLQRIKKANAELEKKVINSDELTSLLENYNDRQTVYKEYLNKNPQAMEQMKSFEKEFASIVLYGTRMKTHKKAVVDCSEQLKDISKRISNMKSAIGTATSNINSLEKYAEKIDNLETGILNKTLRLQEIGRNLLKSKEKKKLKSDLDELQAKLNTIKENIYDKFGYENYLKDCSKEDIQHEIHRQQDHIRSNKDDVKDLEEKYQSISNKQSEHLKEYKYLAVREMSFRKEWQNIINRCHNEYEPPLKYKSSFDIHRLTRNDVEYIKDKLKKNGLSENTIAFKFVQQENQQNKPNQKSHNDHRHRGRSR